MQRLKQLMGTLENLQSNKHLKDKNRPISLFPKTPEEKIATIYMLRLIEASKSDDELLMAELFDAATKAAPTFSDIYKVRAFLYAKKKNKVLADSCYEMALENAINEEDKSYIKNFYAGFLIINNINYEKSLLLINDALCIQPNNFNFLTNKARLFKFSKKFNEALSIYENLFLRFEEIQETRIKKLVIAELLDIKSRIIDDKLVNHQFTGNEYDEIFIFIDSIDNHYYSYQFYKYLIKFAKQILYHFSRILNVTRVETFFNRFYKYMYYVKEDCKDFNEFATKLRKFLNSDKYLSQGYSAIFDVYEYGFVCSINIEKSYGFINVKDWRKNIYFTKSNFKGIFSSNISGRRVKFLPVIEKDMLQALDVELFVDKIEEEDL